MNLAEIQEAIREEKLDGWLFCDHHRRDPLAYRILGLGEALCPTRRWYYLIPAGGEPRGLVHRIEPDVLQPLPGAKIRYSSWDEQAASLKKLLEGCRKVAMQYSPNCAVPYVSMVDAGTIELVRNVGAEVVSSADLVQYFEARWSEEQFAAHIEAGRRVDAIRRSAFSMIGDRQRAGERVDEYQVRQFIRERFAAQGLVTDHGPIVAVNANASNPHYEPSADLKQEIRPGDWVLIDLWAKLDKPDAVYYDITWTGYCGKAVPAEIEQVFRVVLEARDRAVQRAERAMMAKEQVRGYQIDDAARDYIRSKGFGEYFIHRTGHSIGREVHGAGANMDNLETHDERRVIPGTCFSVEPGIYLPEFGVRSEVDVYVSANSAMVTGEMQEEPVLIG